ncbi:MAG: IS110 family transposase [Mizugakiibacter sp.]|uniref:IS110 family transposase n=1 Tax=Mizugakiibacter sp. TaxID=1972610 RepID=UPI00320DCF89
MKKSITSMSAQTIGIDLGDKSHQICILDAGGQIARELQVPNTHRGLEKVLAGLEPALVVMEAGTHSPWISSAIEGWGHEVLVANPRKLRAISDSQNKTDRNDARLLARLGRADRSLLSPIRHRGADAQADLALIKARHGLVKARAMLINQCRGIVKSMGGRLPSCSAESFHKHGEAVPAALRQSLEPLMSTIGDVTTRIRQLERKIERLAEEKYPASARLRAPIGVGPLTALCFMLVVEDPRRFARSRQVGVYAGLTPARDQSGTCDKQLRISKAGDPYLRQLLVQCAQYVLGNRSKPCELKEWGLKLAERGGKAAKKRAVIAVARRLAVQMHRLWVSEEPYDPFWATKRRERIAEQAAARSMRGDASPRPRRRERIPAQAQR